MSHSKLLIFIISMLTALFIIAGGSYKDTSWAAQYSYDEIHPPGWSWSYVHGINDNGDMVGYGGVSSKVIL